MKGSVSLEMHDEDEDEDEISKCRENRCMSVQCRALERQVGTASFSTCRSGGNLPSTAKLSACIICVR